MRSFTSNARIGLWLVLVLATWAMLGCALGDRRDRDRGLAAAYEYHGYDLAGNLIVQGTLRLRTPGSGSIEGDWDLAAADSARALGPQIGQGQLRGSISDSEVIWLNLNPDALDHNVTLTGEFDKGVLSGTWAYTGLAGVLNEGAFTATKIRP